MEITNPTNAKITDGQTTKIVHMNRLHHRAQPQHDSAQPNNIPLNPWAPPQIDHHVVTVLPTPPRYPQRNRRPPDRLQL